MSADGCDSRYHYSKIQSPITNSIVKITSYWPNQPDGDLTWGGIGNIGSTPNGITITSTDFPEWIRYVGYDWGFDGLYVKKGDHVFGQCESSGGSAYLRGGLFFGKNN